MAKLEIGKTYGRLELLERLPGRKIGKRVRGQVLCLCKCGTKRAFPSEGVASGRAASCGCKRQDSLRALMTTHSMTGSPTYICWQSMIRRCHKKSDRAYPGYGGRGIRVCKRWRKSFENFFEDMGIRPSLKHSIDRKDNNGSYEPDNCRWATKTEQARNRRSNCFIEYDGEKRTFQEWCNKLGFIQGSLWKRIFQRGWSVEKAFTTPMRKMKKRST